MTAGLARCPLCRRRHRTYTDERHNGRLHFEHHVTPNTILLQPCEGSSWIVEAEDMEPG